MADDTVKLPELDAGTMPGFAMADDESDLPMPSDPSNVSTSVDTGRSGVEARKPPLVLDGELLPPGGHSPPAGGGNVRYESRIRVLEAFQYRGTMKDAPDWVDRNWAGYGDWDPLRNIPAGPALRVPDRHGGDGAVVLARPGDYVVRQEIVLAHGIPPDVAIEVWAKETFEKTFIPTPEKA